MADTTDELHYEAYCLRVSLGNQRIAERARFGEPGDPPEFIEEPEECLKRSALINNLLEANKVCEKRIAELEAELDETKTALEALERLKNF